MALISIKDRFAFIHIYKVAGMTVRDVLNKNFSTIEIVSSHCTANDIQLHITNDFFVFSFVRNPYDWMISLYNYILFDKTHPFRHYYVDKPFDYFIKHYCENILNKEATHNGRMTDQTEFLYDENGRLLVDYIGRFENFRSDFSRILKRLDININVSNFPIINRTRNKTQIGDYQKYYNKPMRTIVEKSFERDFNNFNYEF